MPAVNSAPLQSTAPVASMAGEQTKMPQDFTVCLSDSVPEMFRRTLTAMIDGQRVSPLIPLPYLSCCSRPEELEEITKPSEGDLFASVPTVEAENEALTSEEEASPWVLKPSVGTWLMPLHAKKEADNEKADDEAVLKPSTGVDTSVPSDSKPQEVNVSTTRSKGLGARVKTWFCCAQASVAEPKPAKIPKTRKAASAKTES